jgi:hypothetical protein
MNSQGYSSDASAPAGLAHLKNHTSSRVAFTDRICMAVLGASGSSWFLCR